MRRSSMILGLPLLLTLAGCQTTAEKAELARISADAYRTCMAGSYTAAAPAVTPPADKAKAQVKAKAGSSARMDLFAKATGLPAPKGKAKARAATAAAPVTTVDPAAAFAAAETSCAPQADAYEATLVKAGAGKKKAAEMRADLAASMRAALLPAAEPVAVPASAPAAQPAQ